MSGAPIEAELDLLVADKVSVAPDIVVLDLIDPDCAPLPRWAPGAHVDLMLGPGLVRQYSLCGDPADRGSWRIAVQREKAGRGGSVAVHGGVAAGTLVRVRGPRNSFPLLPARQYLFIAGGIGITPILPMLAAAEADGVPWQLAYGGRSLSAMAFADDLAARYPGQVHLVPQDEAGLLDLGTVLGQPSPGRHVYCCGPRSLITAVRDRCAGWPPGALHIERYVPGVGRPAVGAVSLDVFRASSGRRLFLTRRG